MVGRPQRSGTRPGCCHEYQGTATGVLSTLPRGVNRGNGGSAVGSMSWRLATLRDRGPRSHCVEKGVRSCQAENGKAARKP